MPRRRARTVNAELIDHLDTIMDQASDMIDTRRHQLARDGRRLLNALTLLDALAFVIAVPIDDIIACRKARFVDQISHPLTIGVLNHQSHIRGLLECESNRKSRSGRGIGKSYNGKKCRQKEKRPSERECRRS